MTLIGLNAAMISLSTGGFLALALASEKPGAALLRRKLAPAQRFGLRLLGWTPLVLALICGMIGWGQGIGWVTWLGCLTIAGAGLAFSFPYYERRRAEKAPPRKPAPAVPLIPPPRSRLLRGLVLAALIAAPLAFLVAAAVRPVQPVMRADAVTGQAGPWGFVIAEEDRAAPLAAVGEVAAKTYQIRFCDGCDSQIRAAYLALGKPVSTDAAGAPFDEDHWNRLAQIQLPDTTSPEAGIWVTVQGRDGSVHATSVPLRRLSPATAQWLHDRKPVR